MFTYFVTTVVKTRSKIHIYEKNILERMNMKTGDRTKGVVKAM
jgi:hypothetical protein